MATSFLTGSNHAAQSGALDTPGFARMVNAQGGESRLREDRESTSRWRGSLCCAPSVHDYMSNVDLS